MGTPCAVLLPTAHVLLTERDVVPHAGRQRSGAFQMSRRQDQQATQFVFIEIPDCIDEVPIEAHDGSSDLERGEQAGRRPPVGERPPEWRSHPVGMLAAQQVPGPRL